MPAVTARQRTNRSTAGRRQMRRASRAIFHAPPIPRLAVILDLLDNASDFLDLRGFTRYAAPSERHSPEYLSVLLRNLLPNTLLSLIEQRDNQFIVDRRQVLDVERKHLQVLVPGGSRYFADSE